MLPRMVWDRRKRLLFSVCAALAAGVAAGTLDVGVGIDIFLNWLTGPLYSYIPSWLLVPLTTEYASLTFSALAFAVGFKVSGNRAGKWVINAVLPDPPPFLSEKAEGQDGEALVGLSGRLDLTGREAELALLAEFAAGTESILWWSICGLLGTGKSRLARHWMEGLRKQGWDVGFLLPSVSAPPEDWRPRRHTLVVIDDSSARAGVWPFVTAMVCRASKSRGKKLRILLIDRSLRTFPAAMKVGEREKLERSRHRATEKKDRRALAIGGLDKNAARRLAHAILGHELSERQFREIFEVTGGNPLSMLIMLRGSGSNDLAKELSVRCQAQIDRAKSIAGPDGATILAIAAVAAPVSTSSVLAVIGNPVEQSTLRDLFSVHDRNFDDTIPVYEPELVGQELALGVIGNRVKMDLLAEKMFELNTVAATTRVARMWQQRPEAACAYATAMGKTLPPNFFPSFSLEGEDRASFEQRVKALLALERARVARTAEPGEEEVEGNFAEQRECAQCGDLATMMDLHEAMMLHLEGWPGARGIALLRVRAIHNAFLTVGMAPLHSGERHSRLQYRVLSDGQRTAENKAAEDWSRYWDEYNPLRSFERLVHRLRLERHLFAEDQELCEQIARALNLALFALGPYLLVSKTEAEARAYLDLVTAISDEISSLSESYPESASIITTLARTKSSLIDIYVAYGSTIEKSGLTGTHWDLVTSLQEWLVLLVRDRPHSADRDLLELVALTSANLVSHFGHHAASLALSSSAEDKATATLFWRRMAGALAQIRALRMTAQVNDDVELSRQLARALDSYIGAHVRVVALPETGLSSEIVRSEIETALGEIQSLQAERGGLPDRELAQYEASALEQLLRGYGLTASADTVVEEEAWSVWERMDALRSRLQQLRGEPAFQDDPVIALEAARASRHAVQFYGAGARATRKSELAVDLWSRMSESLSCLDGIRRPPTLSADLDIARQVAQGAFQQTEAVVLASRNLERVLQESDLQNAAMEAERKLLAIWGQFDSDHEIALLVAAGLRNLITCTPGPHKERVERIRHLAQRFPRPELQVLADSLDAEPPTAVVG